MGNAFQKAVCITVASTMALSGCVTPKKLDAIPASPTRYADLDCEQLSAEAQRLLARYVELGGQIDETAKQDQALVPLAVVSQIFWPLVLLWLPFFPLLNERKKEDEQRQEDYRRLMGERNAILQAAAEMGCPGVQPQPTTEKAASESSQPKASDEPTTVPARPK